MSNPIKQSLDNLAEIAMQIMKKCVDTGELTRTDILFLTMYQKEKARAVSVPTYKKIIDGVKEVVSTIKQVFPQDKEIVEPYVEESEILEVDTDEL